MPGSSGCIGPVCDDGVCRDVIRHRPPWPARMMNQRCIHQGVAIRRGDVYEADNYTQRERQFHETAGELDFAASAFRVGFPHKHKGFCTWTVGFSGSLA